MNLYHAVVPSQYETSFVSASFRLDKTILPSKLLVPKMRKVLLHLQEALQHVASEPNL